MELLLRSISKSMSKLKHLADGTNPAESNREHECRYGQARIPVEEEEEEEKEGIMTG